MPGTTTPLQGTVAHRAPLSLPRLALTLSGPIALVLLSWIYLAMMIGDMSILPGMGNMPAMAGMTDMKRQSGFDPLPLLGLFLMWSVMMAAMMLPTAMPMILSFARMQTADHQRGALVLSVFIFAGGYVAAWTGFSIAATLLQTGLGGLSLLSPKMMKVMSGPLAGGILILAGIYQFTPLKQACLRQCQSPIRFLMTQWREGSSGAFNMGLRHGAFCVGCCWALMALLFVTGVMNTVWIIAITAYVLMEKMIPHSALVSKGIGAGMIAMGIWFIVG